jgi:hypothetical protein
VKPWHRKSLLLLVFFAIPVVTAAQEGKYAGRPVADVLRELQSDRLRIIFSSDLVPPSLRVKAEPKGRTPRDLAQEILASHGLTLQKGPGETWSVVPRSSPPERQAPAPRPPPAQPKQPPTDPAQPPGPGPLRIDERVDVIDRLRETGGSPTAYALEPSAVRDAAGGFENVFQVLQVLPGAAGINDEDGKIAVRGGGPEHNLIVVDGIQIHRPQRLGDFMGSFVNPATIKSVGLDASGLEARYGGRLSSVTTIDTRDGATDRALAVSGALGLTSGDALLEGRLPGTESGSWWVTARGTYYRLLLDRLNKEVKPGFEDLQFKVTVRPSPKTRLTVFGLAGRETMERFPSERGGDWEIARYRGDNSLGVMTLAWTPNASTLATTTLSGYAHRESDREAMYTVGVPPFERATDERDFAARQRFVHAISPRHVVDAGIEVHRIGTGWRMKSVNQPEFWRGLGPSTWGEQIDYAAGPIDTTLRRTQAGFWVQDQLPLGRRWTLEPGVRLDWNSYTGEFAWQPRVRASARVGGSLVWTGVSVQAQTPSHESLQGLDYVHLSPADGDRLRNERSLQVVAGFDRRLRYGLGLRVEGYHRRFDRLLVQRLENDAERALRLSAYEIPPDLPADDVVLERRPTVHPESTGRGAANGLEVLLHRQGRLSGWFAYTLSKATRELHGHNVLFDFDRRHALSTAAVFQLSRRVRLSGTWQLASGFPITPLHEEVSFGNVFDIRTGTIDPIARPSRNPDGSLRTYLAPFMRRLGLRNSDRLSSYSRTDVRVTFSTLGRWEFYGEVINLFAQRNYLITVEFPATPNFPATVSRSNVYSEFERLPTAGLRWRF